MSFCTRCGATVGPGARFCASCGAIVEIGATTPRMSAPPAAAAHGPATGPVGRVQDPILVPVLTLVTLGVYWFIWSWRISKEADAFSGLPGRAHTPVKIGTLIVAVATALILPAYFAIFAGFVGGLPPDVVDGSRELTPREAADLVESVGPWFAVFGIAWLAVLGGYVTLLVGSWRTWRVIEADERARGVPSPLSPGLMLAFIAIPYVNVVAMWFAFYRIQKGLNGVWTAPRGPASRENPSP